VAVLVGLALIGGAFLLVRATRRFGDEPRVMALLTDRPAGRRALKGVLLVLAVATGFVALAQPQYGRGTRVLPATNLDVILVLDYSKSMYARDITPSRTERAKSEVARLIADLPGARFGAVAFAGEPISFPLTNDGGAIAQFFRQLSPSDMPVGGTAIARALELGLDLLRRDPVSAHHRRVMVLVTDGEDLEGDPEAVAADAAKERVTIHVVQIGGRTPEQIPDIDEHGNTVGWRKDDRGQPLTTSLSAAGEEQLGKIASATGGNVVRSERGSTGINEIAASMRKMMTEELSERVETVYADVYVYPTVFALLLLLVEAFVPEARRRKPFPKDPPPPKPVRARKSGRATAAAALLLAVGCRDGLFTRHSPAVDEALGALDGGNGAKASEVLETYLSTGQCKSGELGTPETVRTRANASFDLGLALFRVAERFGAKFGEDPKHAATPLGGSLGGPAPQAPQMPPGMPGMPGAPPEPSAAPSEQRSDEVDCALRVVRIVANDPSTPIDVKANAEYLTGNLEFLRGNYEEAVTAYDSALKLAPARKEDGDDSVGARAAWNRAIALRRIEDDKKKKPDAGKPPEQDGGKPQQQDGGKKKQDDQKKQDEKNDQQKKEDDKKQQQQPDQKKDQQPDQQNAKPDQKRPPPSLSQDERMLDNLEQAPTVQQEDAKRHAGRARVSDMEDK
jgi:Ca-activated chloride channel family protein